MFLPCKGIISLKNQVDFLPDESLDVPPVFALFGAAE